MVLALATTAYTGEPLPLVDGFRDALETGSPESIEDLRRLQEQLRRVVAVVRPATVAVELDDSIGSGVVISADGVVLTAGHVSVEPNREVWLRFPDNRRVRARSYGVNHEVDSGLLRITADPPSDAGWPFVPLAEAVAEAGQWVVAIGQPNGFFVDRNPPVRLGRVLMVTDDTITTDATLVGGDSGGPLANLRGEILGIHSRIGERITNNFHVPVTAYRSEWDRLVAGRMTGVPDGQDAADYRPLIGLALRVVDGRCVVTQVFEGGAADQANVRVGDVLSSFAGQPVDSADTLALLVGRQSPFDRAPLVVRRGDEELTIEVWLGRAANDFPGARPRGGGSQPRRRPSW